MLIQINLIPLPQAGLGLGTAYLIQNYDEK